VVKFGPELKNSIKKLVAGIQGDMCIFAMLWVVVVESAVNSAVFSP